MRGREVSGGTASAGGEDWSGGVSTFGGGVAICGVRMNRNDHGCCGGGSSCSGGAGGSEACDGVGDGTGA